MKNRVFFFLVLFFFIGCTTSEKSATQKLEQQIIAGETPADHGIAKALADSAQALLFAEIEKSKNLKALYGLNQFQPYWASQKLVDEAFHMLCNAKNHGLDPDFYQVKQIDSLMRLCYEQRPDAPNLVKLEIQLTKSIQAYAFHLKNGVLNPTDFHSSWNFPKEFRTGIDSVWVQLAQNKKISEFEKSLAPQTDTYKCLQKELGKYELLIQEKTKTETLNFPGFINRKGDSNRYVAILKKHFSFSDSANWKFTNALEDSIKKLQKKHGINCDGIPGKNTYTLLDWTPQRYADAIKVNLERLRWLPDSLSETCVLVNIPSAKTQLVFNNQTIFESRVIVGKPDHETPVYQSEIEYLVFNPCWTVPNSIASKSILPRIKKDTNYLATHNMFVGINGTELAADRVDYEKLFSPGSPYKIYQRSGDDNALGQVKFMFPNPYSIYLHDTPNKSYFLRDNRALSHGCVRVNDALKLADLLLYKTNQHPKSIDYYFSKGYPVKATLIKPVPIFIIYLTLALESGSPTFYTDVYQQDTRLMEAFSEFTPTY